MATDNRLLNEDEYVMLIYRYEDIPAQSVGRIARAIATHPPCYRVSFGPLHERGPIPARYLARLSERRERERG